MSSSGGQLKRVDSSVSPADKTRPTAPPSVLSSFLTVSQPDDSASTGTPPELAPDDETGSSNGLHSQVVFNLLRAANALRSTLSAHFAEFGLNEIRYFVLQAIRDASPDGCSQAELAERLGKYESSISALVDRMRSDRLIYRLRSKRDRRKRILLLTENGRQALAKIEQCHTARMGVLLDGIDSSQLGVLDSLLRLLIAELSGKQSAIPISPVEAPETPLLRVS